MKLHTATLFFFGSVFATVVYVFTVTPSLENPLTLAGFYVLSAASLMSGIYRILNFFKHGTKRYLWALSGTIYFLYLGALATLNALSIANVSLATTVLLALIFMIDRS